MFCTGCESNPGQRERPASISRRIKGLHWSYITRGKQPEQTTFELSQACKAHALFLTNKWDFVETICLATAFVYLSRSPGAGLECLFKFVESSVSQNTENEDGEKWGPPVLLIDDLSVLLSLGVSAGAILDFTLYCQATICSELQASLSVFEPVPVWKTVQVLKINRSINISALQPLSGIRRVTRAICSLYSYSTLRCINS